jgi:restriction endonuclease Mrr
MADAFELYDLGPVQQPRQQRDHVVEVGRARAQLFHERLNAQTERIRRYLEPYLRPGLSVTDAGQTYSTLTGPEVYHLHTIDLEWTAARHRAWLTRLLESELLGVDTNR